MRSAEVTGVAAWRLIVFLVGDFFACVGVVVVVGLAFGCFERVLEVNGSGGDAVAAAAAAATTAHPTDFVL